MLKRLILLLLLICSNQYYNSQIIFAELQGSPAMITTGWNLAGAAYIGDTGGDADAFNNELILTDNVGNSSGAIFYSHPIDLGTCNQWNVQFDFRMFDGTAADGIAFCFLDVPPTGFVTGGGVGIPSTANGIKVVLDTYNNCGGPNPGIQIYSGPGYNECIAGITSIDNIGGSLSFLRSNTYSTAEISYDYGEITVTINGTLYLTANYNVNFAGFMGFTASTGGSNDIHSVRDVTIYADIAESDAGPDLSICSGETVQIGTASNVDYLYSWNTSTNLNDSTLSDPSVTLVNTGNTPIVEQYVVETILASNPNSCPFFDTVEVTVNPLQQSILDETICQGISYSFGGQDYSIEGSYVEVFSDINGCDSTVTLNLTVLSELTSELNESICQGGFYELGGQPYIETGTYTYFTQNAQGCDSTVTLNLVVEPELTSEINASICQGGMFEFGGQPYIETGTYTYFTQNTQGCDSTVTLNLVVEPELTSEINASICQGGMFEFGAQQYSESGTYTYFTQNAQGCDSTVTLNLNVNPVQEYEYTLSICEGESYNFNGELVETANTYSTMLQTAEGCDSLVILELIVYPLFESDQSIEICTGGSFFYDGQELTANGLYPFVFQSANGCDSVVNIDLLVHPVPAAPELSSNSPVSCPGDIVSFSMPELANATYQWYGPAGYSSQYPENELSLNLPQIGSYFGYYILNSCPSDTSSIELDITNIYGFDDFDFPNVISPNDDGINDELQIKEYFKTCQEFELSIYNRWGNKVFSQFYDTPDFAGSTPSGNELQEGVYYFVLRINDVSKSGYIHVVK